MPPKRTRTQASPYRPRTRRRLNFDPVLQGISNFGADIASGAFSGGRQSDRAQAVMPVRRYGPRSISRGFRRFPRRLRSRAARGTRRRRNVRPRRGNRRRFLGRRRRSRGGSLRGAFRSSQGGAFANAVTNVTSSPFRFVATDDQAVTNASTSSLNAGLTRASGSVFFSPSQVTQQTTAGSQPAFVATTLESLARSILPYHPHSYLYQDAIHYAVVGGYFSSYGASGDTASRRVYFRGGKTTHTITNTALAPCHLKCYLIQARNGTNITQTTDVDSDPWVAFRDGLANEIGLAGGTTRIGSRHVDATPFMSPTFCMRFKILKRRTFVLQPGGVKVLSITCGPSMEPVSEWISQQSGTYNYTTVRKGNRYWFCQAHWGLHSSNVTTTAADQLEVGYAPGSLAISNRTILSAMPMLNGGTIYRGYWANQEGDLAAGVNAQEQETDVNVTA